MLPNARFDELTCVVCAAATVLQSSDGVLSCHRSFVLATELIFGSCSPGPVPLRISFRTYLEEFAVEMSSLTINARYVYALAPPGAESATATTATFPKLY